jgi:hypothetical protein
MLGCMARPLLATATVAALSLASDAAPGGAAPGGVPPTRITVWGAAPAGLFGGATYAAPLAGAMITERRELELGGGEVRIAGIAATIDPGSVQLRDLTEPGVSITEQRFVPGAATPTELLARHIGDPVTVVTGKGEVAGVLRAADEEAIVVELGAGDQRRLSVMRRDYVQDVRLPAGRGHQPSLVLRMAGKKPGKHAIELTYRATGLSWTADYLAVLDEAARAVDFSAWATVKNATGATFERAELTLASGGVTPGPAAAGKPGPLRFTVPSPVRLAAGDAVQVELFPARVAAKAVPVVAYEAMEDPSPGYQDLPGSDCSEYTGGGLGGTTELALELAVPSAALLPEGRVRLFRRQGERLEIVSEEDLRPGAGVARIKLSGDAEITGERKALSCNVDEHAKTIHERVRVRLENKGGESGSIRVPSRESPGPGGVMDRRWQGTADDAYPL